MIIERNAVRIQQGSLTLYATAFKVEHLLQDGFYKVDKLDADDTNSGYQRILDNSRAKRLAQYLLDGLNDGDAFLPTSIFLATGNTIFYDSTKNMIKIDTDKIGPFNVVDGQHRIQGLIEAAKLNPKIKEFEVLANIADGLDDISQMCHFLIVNTTQKSVDKSVEQQIIARLSSMVDVEVIPTLPKWIQRQVLRGEEKEALFITKFLNDEVDSPWHNKIRMANQIKTDSTTINQNSFVQTIKEYILSSSNPLSAITDMSKRNMILKNYWKAIADILVDKQDENTVIFKTIGLELFCFVSTTVLNLAFSAKDFRVDKFKEIINSAFQELPSEYISIQYPDYWKSGGEASTLNKNAMRKIGSELNKCINKPKVKNSDQEFLL